MQVTTTTRHLTASMVVIDADQGSVLLVHHIASGRWQFPGGHVDSDETPAEAAVREVLEETGVHAKVAGPGLDLPGMVAHPSPWITAEILAPAKPDRPGKPAEPAHSHIDLLFIGTADSAAAVTAQVEEVAGVRWVPFGRLGDIDVREEVPALAQRAFQLLTSDETGAGR